MKFHITVPKASQSALLTELAKLDHVRVEGSKGNVSHESGLEFAFEPVHGDNVQITVLKNPEKVEMSEIRKRLEADVKTILAGSATDPSLAV